MEGYEEPTGLTTDGGVDVLENVIAPALGQIIDDFAKVEAHADFLTTITTDMHFGFSSVVKVDRGDVYVLEAITYGLKAFLHYVLAYQLRTDPAYWQDNLDPESPVYDPEDPSYVGHPYQGLQDVIDRDPGSEGEKLFDFVADPDASFTRSQNAFSYGLAKLKAGLNDINARSIADKNAEDHIFNVADVSDEVAEGVNVINIARVIQTITEARAALEQQTRITVYDDYDDDSAEPEFETVDVDGSVAFDSSLAMNRDRLWRYYYHQDSEEDVPIFDTNNPSSSDPVKDFITGLIKNIDGTPLQDLEDILARELLPSPYYFSVPVVESGAMSIDGRLDDYEGLEIKAVMFDEVDDDVVEGLDIRKVYLAQDAEDLYIAIELASTPLDGPFGEGEYLNYALRFNVRYPECDWYTVPISVELHGSGRQWRWYVYSYGQQVDELTAEGAMRDVVEIKISLSNLSNWVALYQRGAPEGWQWSGKDIYMAVSLWSRLSSVEAGDWVSEALVGVDLNIAE
jgi:hypothetical protein